MGACAAYASLHAQTWGDGSSPTLGDGALPLKASLIVVVAASLCVAGCGGNAPTPQPSAPASAPSVAPEATTAAPSAPSTPAAAPTAAPVTSVASSAEPIAGPTTSAPNATAKPQRQQDAEKWLPTILGPTIGLEHRGLLSANGLRELQFRLPKELRLALGAVASKQVDPSMRARIFDAALREPSVAPTVLALCGGTVEAVLDPAAKAKPEAAAKLVADKCGLAKRLGVEPAELAQLHYLSLLTAAVAHELLAQQPEHCAAELELAKLIRNVARLDGK